MKSKKMLGYFMLMVTAVIWGTSFVFQRTGMESIEPITFSFARMYLAAAALCIVAIIKDRAEIRKGTAPSRTMSPEEYKKYKRETLIGGFCCGLCLSGGSLFQQMGIVYTTAGKAGFITAMYMFIVPVIGVIFLRKKVRWVTWIAVAFGVVGLYLLSINEEFSVSKGDGLVMVCALFYALHILCCDHFAGKGDALRISMLQFLTVGIVGAIFAFIFETPTWEKIASAAIPILFCGLLSGAMGYTLQMVAQKWTDPTIASLIMSLESVFAAISGALILHETMSSRELSGCLTMFAALLLVQIPLPERK